MTARCTLEEFRALSVPVFEILVVSKVEPSPRLDVERNARMECSQKRQINSLLFNFYVAVPLFPSVGMVTTYLEPKWLKSLSDHEEKNTLLTKS